MTLPNEEVLELLASRFVLGHRNIEKDGHVGLSHGYKCNQSALGTTNGAGGRNVQFVVLAADGTVVHALPGFWHAEDLVPELLLGLDLHKLYTDDRLPADRKTALFDALHRRHMRTYGEAAEHRGAWQGFDQHAELARARNEPRDTVIAAADGSMTLKSIPRIVHERLLRRRFLPLADFDMESFVDYGRAFYDNNEGFDRGRTFLRAERANVKREREQQREREATARAEQRATRSRTGR